MIIREWRGRADVACSEAYPQHFHNIVVPELKHIPGFLGACLTQRKIDNKIEFLVLTRWKDIDAVRAFAGSQIDKAVVEPSAVAVLVDFDEIVSHHEVIEEISNVYSNDMTHAG